MNCKTADCTAAATGKSKYCTPHKQAAREAFKAMLAAKDGEKEARDQAHADLLARARAAGLAAGQAVSPTPMIVGSPTHFLGSDIDPTKPTYYVGGGVCGFAWVMLRPATSSFARWAVKHEHARSSSYEGGARFSVFEFGQSMERKEAYASAFAQVLQDAGLRAYAGSRMD